MKYRILAGMKGEKHKMAYRDPFTGKELQGDKVTIEKILFMLTCQFEKEDFEIQEIKN